MVPLFARRYLHAQAVLRRRQGARCVGRKCAGRIDQSIEVEPDFTGLIDAVVGKVGEGDEAEEFVDEFDDGAMLGELVGDGVGDGVGRDEDGRNQN